MNTITNFYNQNNLYSLNYQQSKQNIQFKGLNGRLKPNKKTKEHLISRNYNFAHILNQEPEDIIKITKKTSQKRKFFFNTLVDNYSLVNSGLSDELKENFKYVNHIFNMIKYPNKKHLGIIKNNQGSMEQLEQIFLEIGYDNKKIKFVKILQKMLHTKNELAKERVELILELLQSPNLKIYMKDFSKYKSYLLLNKNDENAIKNLDKMVEAKTFNHKKYDIELDSQTIFNENNLMLETDVLNKKSIEANYKPESQLFIDRFIFKHGISIDSLKSGNDKDILDMYKSINKNNINIRSQLLCKLFFDPIINSDFKGKNESITELKQLFETIDNNKHAKRFIKKIIKKPLPEELNTAKEFNKLFAEQDIKKLDIFYDNAMNIIRQTKGQVRTETLKNEIKNPFFLTPEKKVYLNDAVKSGYIKKETILFKVFKKLKNKFNIMLDNATPLKLKISDSTKTKEL